MRRNTVSAPGQGPREADHPDTFATRVANRHHQRSIYELAQALGISRNGADKRLRSSGLPFSKWWLRFSEKYQRNCLLIPQATFNELVCRQVARLAAKIVPPTGLPRSLASRLARSPRRRGARSARKRTRASAFSTRWRTTSPGLSSARTSPKRARSS